MQNIYNKLFKKRSTPVKQSLKSKKVELSMKTQIEDEFRLWDKAFGIASFYANERFDQLFDDYDNAINPIKEEVQNVAVNSEAGLLEDYTDELYNSIDDFKNQLNEIGVNPEDVEVNTTQGTYNLSQLEDLVGGSGWDMASDFKEKYREFTDYTGFAHLGG